MTAEAKKTLWIAVLVPPVVWGLQGAFGWFVASHACPGTSQPWSLGVARWAVAIASLIALAVSSWALVASLRRYRDEQAEERLCRRRAERERAEHWRKRFITCR